MRQGFVNLLLVAVVAWQPTQAEVYVSILCGRDDWPCEEGGTREKPFKTIYRAAECSPVIILLPNVGGPPYPWIEIRGDWTIIGEGGPDLTICKGFQAAGKNFRLVGLQITNPRGPGVAAYEKCSTHIENCVIHSCGGDGIYLQKDCNWAGFYIVNCTIVENNESGIATWCHDDCCAPGYSRGRDFYGTIQNCIIAQNRQYGIELGYQFYASCGGDVLISWNSIRGNVKGQIVGQDRSDFVRVSKSVNLDPCFVNRKEADFHLCCPEGEEGLFHRGNPGASFRNPDGTRNTLGAYGGPASEGFYQAPDCQLLERPQIKVLEVQKDDGKIRIRVVARPAQ